MPSRLNDWLDRIQRRHPPVIELGLERCDSVWARMGRPRPASRVVIVAGTNGKGSTVAGIEAGLTALGHRVGCYTSPHILRYNERIRIDGSDADDNAIVEGFERVEAALDNDTHLTYFEFATLGAFATMARSRLDFAVLEVGLGGRLDAVNILDADLAVITPIGIDHQAYLGVDREAIGREKAGVMRRGQTVVCSDRQPPDSVFEAATERGARLIRIGADFDVSRDPGDAEQSWQYYFGDRTVALRIAMGGAHQADNLAGALTAVLQCDPTAQERLGEIAAAVAQCRVRGRLERVADRPCVIVDVGHNPMAAVVIRDYLDAQGAGRCRAVLATLEDKDVEGLVSILDGHVAKWYCAGLTGPRGQAADAIAGRLGNALPDAQLAVRETVPEALDAALADAQGDGVVLVLGSFLTAGQAIAHIEGPSC